MKSKKSKEKIIKHKKSFYAAITLFIIAGSILFALLLNKFYLKNIFDQIIIARFIVSAIILTILAFTFLAGSIKKNFKKH